MRIEQAQTTREAVREARRVKGTTTSGFCFDLPADAIDNMELVDALADAQDDNPIAISRVCRLLLGEGVRKALYAHLRTPEGRVPVEAVSREILEIFAGFGQAGKN